MKTVYFAYGSNMNLDQMRYRCSGAIYDGKAKLKNWKYFINKDGYASIRQSKHDYVLGCLWHLNEPDWLNLDKYEAVEEGYYYKREISVFAEDSRSKISAIVYISTNCEMGKPSKSYNKEVLDGAMQIGLPSEYIISLNSWYFQAS